MRPAFRCGVLAFALAVLAGCGQREDGGAGQAQAALAKPSASAAAEPAVARLGALQVAPDELKALLAEVPAETRVQLSENRDALERWMRARLAEKALYEQAGAQDWQQRPQVKTLIDAAARQIVLRTYLESVSTVPEDYPSDAELQAAYQANKAQLAVPALYRVSQIFIAASAAGGLAEARKRAQELYRQAADGDFAELARKHSDDPQTARNGGDIGGAWAAREPLAAPAQLAVRRARAVPRRTPAALGRLCRMARRAGPAAPGRRRRNRAAAAGLSGVAARGGAVAEYRHRPAGLARRTRLDRPSRLPVQRRRADRE